MTSELSAVPHPIVLWAQRKDLLFLKVQIADCTSPKVETTSDSLSFEAKTPISDAPIKFSLNFYDAIEVCLGFLISLLICE